MDDTVEWLLKYVPGNSGRVGIWGMSYPSFYTSASIIDSHPAIKAASIQAPMTSLFLGETRIPQRCVSTGGATLGVYAILPTVRGRTGVPFSQHRPFHRLWDVGRVHVFLKRV